VIFYADTNPAVDGKAECFQHSKVEEKSEAGMDILAVAVNFEKDSVVFYTSMKKVIPPNLGREKIDRLMDLEMSHISLLIQRQKKFAVQR
jgi:rubrerythrin